MPRDEFVIHSATGRRMITVTHNGTGVHVAVRASRNGDSVTITSEEAEDLAAALTRRWPMIGAPTPESQQ